LTKWRGQLNYTVEPRYFELAGGTKNCSKYWELEIADRREKVKGKSKGNGFEFEIMGNSK